MTENLSQYPWMTGEELKTIRLSLGLSLSDMAKMLGYQSESPRNLNTMMRDLEAEKKPIRGAQERFAIAYRDGYRPSDWPD